MEQRGIGEITKADIQVKLANVGDFVKMDFLQQCLKKTLDFETRKFVLLTLAGIYEQRHMYLEAGKLIRNAAEINTTFEGKMQDFMKSAELLVRSGACDEARVSFAKAMGSANERQKPTLREQYKKAHFTTAEEFLKKDKRKHALEAYESLLALEFITPEEKRKAQIAVLPLYEKLGKIKEFMSLKKQLQ
jgi:tetratricopeptide (TPR) repeat protein